MGKSPCIVFGICNYGNNVKKCAGRQGLCSDPTYWPTDPLYTISPESEGNNGCDGVFQPTAFQKLHFWLCDSSWTLLLHLSLSASLLFLRFGRHPVLILSVFFMLVFGLSVAFSVNVTMFSTLRFFEGFCLAGLALSLYVLSKYLLSPPPPSAFSFLLSSSSIFSLSSSFLCV